MDATQIQMSSTIRENEKPKHVANVKELETSLPIHKKTTMMMPKLNSD
jgi:hypothetical protein